MPEGMSAGEVFVKVRPDFSSFGSEMQQSLQREGNRTVNVGVNAAGGGSGTGGGSAVASGGSSGGGNGSSLVAAKLRHEQAVAQLTGGQQNLLATMQRQAANVHTAYPLSAFDFNMQAALANQQRRTQELMQRAYAEDEARQQRSERFGRRARARGRFYANDLPEYETDRGVIDAAVERNVAGDLRRTGRQNSRWENAVGRWAEGVLSGIGDEIRDNAMTHASRIAAQAKRDAFVSRTGNTGRGVQMYGDNDVVGPMPFDVGARSGNARGIFGPHVPPGFMRFGQPEGRLGPGGYGPPAAPGFVPDNIFGTPGSPRGTYGPFPAPGFIPHRQPDGRLGPGGYGPAVPPGFVPQNIFGTPGNPTGTYGPTLPPGWTYSPSTGSLPPGIRPGNPTGTFGPHPPPGFIPWGQPGSGPLGPGGYGPATATGFVAQNIFGTPVNGAMAGGFGPMANQMYNSPIGPPLPPNFVPPRPGLRRRISNFLEDESGVGNRVTMLAMLGASEALQGAHANMVTSLNPEMLGPAMLARRQMQVAQQVGSGLFGGMASAGLSFVDAVSFLGGASSGGMSRGYGLLGRYSPLSAAAAQAGADNSIKDVSANSDVLRMGLQSENDRAVLRRQRAEAGFLAGQGGGASLFAGSRAASAKYMQFSEQMDAEIKGREEEIKDLSATDPQEAARARKKLEQYRKDATAMLGDLGKLARTVGELDTQNALRAGRVLVRQGGSLAVAAGGNFGAAGEVAFEGGLQNAVDAAPIELRGHQRAVNNLARRARFAETNFANTMTMGGAAGDALRVSGQGDAANLQDENLRFLAAMAQARPGQAMGLMMEHAQRDRLIRRDIALGSFGLAGEGSSLSLRLGRRPFEAQAQDIVTATALAQAKAGNNADRDLLGQNAATQVKLLGQSIIDQGQAVQGSFFRSNFQGGNVPLSDQLLKNMNDWLKQIADNTKSSKEKGLPVGVAAP